METAQMKNDSRRNGKQKRRRKTFQTKLNCVIISFIWADDKAQNEFMIRCCHESTRAGNVIKSPFPNSPEVALIKFIKKVSFICR